MRSCGGLWLLLFAVGCDGPTSGEKELDRMVTSCQSVPRTTHRTSRNSVVPLFARVHEPSATGITVEALPREVLSLNPQKPSSAWFEAVDKQEDKSLWVWWGGGFGSLWCHICPFGGPATHQTE